MDSNIDFKSLWSKQQTETPDISIMMGEIKSLKRKFLKRVIIANTLLLLTSAFIIFIWIYFQPAYFTTKLGIVFVLLAMLSFLLMLNRTYPLTQKAAPTESNHDYLQALLQIQKRQRFMHTTMTNIYFALLSVGLALYMFEYTQRMSFVAGVMTYGISAIWILVNWFYFRPRQIKKQQAELDKVIIKMESINGQLESA